MDRVQGGQAIAVVSLKPGTYLLAPKDSGGRLGPVVTISEDGIGALTFSPIGLLMDDTLFAGPRIGTGVLPSGGLVLTSTALFSAIPLMSAVGSVAWLDGMSRLTGSYGFGVAMDLATAPRIRLRSVINHVSMASYDRISRRSGPIPNRMTCTSASGWSDAERAIPFKVRFALAATVAQETGCSLGAGQKVRMQRALLHKPREGFIS